MGGTLVFRASRVPVQTLLDYLDDGYSLDEFLGMFPSVDREDARNFCFSRGETSMRMMGSSANAQRGPGIRLRR